MDKSINQMNQTRVYNSPKKKNYGDMKISSKTTPLRGNEE